MRVTQSYVIFEVIVQLSQTCTLTSTEELLTSPTVVQHPTAYPQTLHRIERRDFITSRAASEAPSFQSYASAEKGLPQVSPHCVPRVRECLCSEVSMYFRDFKSTVRSVAE